MKKLKPLQRPLFTPPVEWDVPSDWPDLSSYKEIAIDLETCDPDLKTMGSGSVRGEGFVVGFAIAA